MKKVIALTQYTIEDKKLTCSNGILDWKALTAHLKQNPQLNWLVLKNVTVPQAEAKPRDLPPDPAIKKLEFSPTSQDIPLWAGTLFTEILPNLEHLNLAGSLQGKNHLVQFINCFSNKEIQIWISHSQWQEIQERQLIISLTKSHLRYPESPEVNESEA